MSYYILQSKAGVCNVRTTVEKSVLVNKGQKTAPKKKKEMCTTIACSFLENPTDQMLGV